MIKNKNVTGGSGSSGRLLSFIAWVVALGTVAYAAYLWQVRPPAYIPFIQTPPPAAASPETSLPPTSIPEKTQTNATLPPYQAGTAALAIFRAPNLHTIVPTRPRTEITTYKVDTGDSVFGIADYFGVEPETVLWANYDLLNDNPDYLAPGMELYIPPVDGVYYQWKEGDTLETVADAFEAKMDDIIAFMGNKIDLFNPVVEPGAMVMIPGGHREFRQWLIPTIARGNAGVNNTALGPGACSGSYDGAFGSGAFVWPAANHYLSGNDYWSGHLGLDIAAGEGANIYAADSGVVVFAGWANGGYGNTVMVDHGNGYQTLYAHMSTVATGCGASVSAGQTIGYAGSTGNSTGAHLHFEVRLNGGFVNPWFVLPAP